MWRGAPWRSGWWLPVVMAIVLTAATGRWEQAASGAGDNPALRVIEERIGEYLNLFADCRSRRVATISECFADGIGPETTAAAIACFGEDRVPRSASQEQRSCLLDVSFIHDQENVTGFFGAP